MSEKTKKRLGGWMLRLVCICIDVSLGLGALCLFKVCLLHQVFELEIHQIYSFIKVNPYIIQWIVWPISVVLFIFAFRDVVMQVLYQIPEFIKRSRYGSPCVEPERPKGETPDPEECLREGDEKDHLDKENSSARSPNGDEASSIIEGKQFKYNEMTRPLRMTASEAKHLADCAIKKIAKNYGLMPSGAARVRGTSYVFDSILQDGLNLYGVEVKCGYNSTRIEKTLHELEEFRFSLPTNVRNRFKIILCVISLQTDYRWREDLMHKVKGSDLIVRMFSREELARDLIDRV